MTTRPTRLRKARLGTGVLAVALLAPAAEPAVAGAQDPGEEQENEYEGGNEPGGGAVDDLAPGEGTSDDIVEENAQLPGDNDDPADGLDEDGPVETEQPAIGEDEAPAAPAPPPVAPAPPPAPPAPRSQVTPPAAPGANAAPAPRTRVAPVRRAAKPERAEREKRRQTTNAKPRPRRATSEPAAAPAPPAQPGPSSSAGGAADGARTRQVAATSVAPRTHTVRAGETLWSIASARLGDGASAAQIAREVQRIWNLNAAAIGTGDPSLVGVGVVLRLG